MVDSRPCPPAGRSWIEQKYERRNNGEEDYGFGVFGEKIDSQAKADFEKVKRIAKKIEVQ